MRMKRKEHTTKEGVEAILNMRSLADTNPLAVNFEHSTDLTLSFTAEDQTDEFKEE